MDRKQALQALKDDPELLMELERQLKEKAASNPDNPKIKKLMGELSPLFKGSPEKGAAIREKLTRQEGPYIERELSKVDPGFDLGAHATALKRGLAGTVAPSEDIAGMAAAVGGAGTEERDWMAGPKRAWESLKSTFDLSPVGEFVESPSLPRGIQAGQALMRGPQALANPALALGGLLKEGSIGNILGMAPATAEAAALEQLASDEASMQKDPTSAFTESIAPAVLGAAGAKAGPPIGRSISRHVGSFGRKARDLQIGGIKPFAKMQPPPLPIEESLRIPEEFNVPQHRVPVTPKMIEESIPAPGSTGAVDIELAALKKRLAKQPPTSAPPMDIREVEPSRAPIMSLEDVPHPPSMLPETKQAPFAPMPSALQGKFDPGKGAFIQTPQQLNEMANSMLAEMEARKAARLAAEPATKNVKKPSNQLPPAAESVFESRPNPLAEAKTVSKRKAPSLEEPTIKEEAPDTEVNDPFAAYRAKHVPPELETEGSTNVTELQRLLAEYNARFGPRTVKLPPRK